MPQFPVVNSNVVALRANLTQAQHTPTPGADGAAGVNFLRFDAKRTGDWFVGRDNEECSGDLLALDISSIQHGWILWHAKKATRLLTALHHPLPPPMASIEYIDNKGKPAVDEPGEARAFSARFLNDDGTAEPTVIRFETNSFGGRKAVDAVIKPLIERATAGSDYLFPMIRLATSSYEHASYGMVFEPVFTIEGWANAAGELESVPAGTIAGPAAAPAPEPEPEPTPEPPRRRRRAAV